MPHRGTTVDAMRRIDLKRLSMKLPEVGVEAPRIRVGVCAMEKKASAKPMRSILTRMNSADEFEIIIFPEHVILNEPVEEWPLCDCLMSWHSDGFPLEKAQDYWRLRKPILINDVLKQTDLLDRRKVHQRLMDAQVPLPNHIVVNRTEEQAEQGLDPPGFVETCDYVEMNGKAIHKPFVEKPASAEDHNIWIYYPNSMGGGVKMLFRKVGNKSADYLPNHPGTVRRNGSFIYEEFMSTGGTDVKVYTVGPRYAHAEARKSPVVDGKVQRTAEGKEVRFPVLLTVAEKDIARRVSMAFNQKVCGFDLLRCDGGKFYVCDVNGWSFVKNSKKYYDDAAEILRNIIISSFAPHRMLCPLPRKVIEDEIARTDPVVVEEQERMVPGLSDLEMELEHTDQVGANEELRCVLAVIRHGDRTPKQKVKVKVKHPLMIELFGKYKDAKGKQAKLKSPAQLQDFLDAVRLLATEEMNDETRNRLHIVETVLKQGGTFSGINRKVQLKPTFNQDGEIEELLLIVKWGGVLTHLGRRQAEELGYIYRMVMYPRSVEGTGGGLLRLHSTYRHDFKCHSSDEGRVQTTAAAFIKALLDLEGSSLTPILVSLVNRDSGMLDAFGKGASDDIIHSKQTLYHMLTYDPSTGKSHCAPFHTTPRPSTRPSSPDKHAPHPNGTPAPPPETPPTPGTDPFAGIKVEHMLENPLAVLRQLEAELRVLVGAIQALKDANSRNGAAQEKKFYSALLQDYSDYEQEDGEPYGVEDMAMMLDRWSKLLNSFYSKKDDTFDISKIPDIYDSAKYDCIHNTHLGLDLTKVFPLAKTMADCVISAEYGITPEYKLRIATKIATELLGKLMLDFHNVQAESLASARSDEVGALANDSFDHIRGSEPEHVRPDTSHRLAADYVDDVNSPLRHVRTRMYFTSESHIHALVNILRYNQVDGKSLLSEEGRKMLADTLEYDYLTQIVLRMYENKAVPHDSEERFRIEIMFSNGANYNPLEAQVQCTRPRTPIHRDSGVSLQALERHLSQYAADRSQAPAASIAFLMNQYTAAPVQLAEPPIGLHSYSCPLPAHTPEL